VQFVGVLKVWLIYENVWKGNFKNNPPQDVINKSSVAEYKECRSERRHELDGCYYVNLHKWCTRKVTENGACEHGDMVNLQHFSNCYI